MNLLFVCSKNRKRSPTAEAVFSGKDGIESIGAGINPDSPTPLTGDLIEWADIVMVMENGHRRRVMDRFEGLLKSKKLIVLGIPDHYEYMDDKLVALLERKVKAVLQLGQ
ncbi:MAG: phosphotyrosine protein phosphatase [Candidatus Sumerlaeota bacterium]